MTASHPKIQPDDRLCLLMHDNLTGGYGKMGLGLLRYCEAKIAAVVDRENAGGNLQALTRIPRQAPITPSVRQSLPYRPNLLVIGVAPPGGVLPSDWWNEIKEGLRSGMSLVNGLYRPLAGEPELQALLQPDRFIWDVRQEPPGLSNGSGAARHLSAKRILTVGTDMGVGKMTVSLELDRAAKKRGIRSRFLASGQIGICIAGEGVALDAVRVDFASGAVERMVTQYGSEDLLWIEGQGSAIHPASTAWLPLIRGSCPTHLILVHRAGQTALYRYPDIAIPPLNEISTIYESVASSCGLYPPARIVGVALNCAHLTDEAAHQAIKKTADETGIPVTDAIRFGVDPLLDAVLDS